MEMAIKSMIWVHNSSLTGSYDLGYFTIAK